jgi:hypothetical protein
MNLQTIRNRKKAQQGGSMMDALILDKLYGQVESIVKEEFDKNKRELYKKLNADYTESLKQLDKKTQELEKLLENKGEVTQKDISKALADVQKLKVDMQENHESLIAQLSTEKDQITQEVNQKTDTLIKEIEKQRGPQGIQGKPGKDGSPDTAKQVVEKVNKQGGVKITAIDGLLDKLDAIKKLSRGGKSGGGMGDPQHESKSVGTSTTTINTNYPIAANGNAIYKVAYRNFIWHKGIHFNVGSNRKTITLTQEARNVLVDNSTIELTYTRG